MNGEIVMHRNLSVLRKAIAAVIPVLVKEWNTVKLPEFERIYEQSFASLYKNRQTQEKTKAIAPFIDVMFARLIKEYIPDFEIDETVGRDYTWDKEGWECKITFGSGVGWTGNGYAKTSNHILLRFTLTEDGVMTEMFAALTDLDDCKSNWTDPTNKSNFSTLAFLKEDEDKLDVIIGDTKINSVYIKPIMCVVETDGLWTHI
jgi:hypothetical protein